MVRKLLSMCACHAHPTVKSVYTGARPFVHCVCILCTLLSLLSCEKAITDDDSVVSGSPADKNANLTVTVFSIEKTPFGTLTSRAYAPATRAATPASALTSPSTMKAAPASSRSIRPLPKPISARPPSSSRRAPTFW